MIPAAFVLLLLTMCLVIVLGIYALESMDACVEVYSRYARLPHVIHSGVVQRILTV
jgi:hypothetical protein